MKKLCFLALLLSVIVAAGRSKDDDYLGPNSNISDRFDPLFAQVLEKRGYVDDAEHITLAEVKDITELDVSERELTSLRGIEYFESLTELYCFDNQLTSLNVSNNAALETLWCGSNQLTTLNVSNCTALTELACGENELITLDVSKNTVLTELECGENELTSLDVSKNTALRSLHCYSNRLITLDVSKNMELRELSCDRNPGDGAVFPITAWFDNNSIPGNFTAFNWNYNGKAVRIDYRKAE